LALLPSNTDGDKNMIASLNWWLLGPIAFYIAFILLLIGLVKLLGEFLHTKFMRKYVSDRMYDVAMGVIIGQLFIAAIAMPIITFLLAGLTR
jgi:hypothetical protein